MGELDDIRLFFSLEEKKAFLERQGYKIERHLVERELNIYQNAFMTVQSAEVVAVKDGVQYGLHEIFEKELKIKLLKL